MGLVPRKEMRGPELSLSPPREDIGRVSHLPARKWALTRHRTCWHLDLGRLAQVSPGESHGQRSLVATVHRIAKSWTQLSTHTLSD